MASTKDTLNLRFAAEGDQQALKALREVKKGVEDVGATSKETAAQVTSVMQIAATAIAAVMSALGAGSLIAESVKMVAQIEREKLALESLIGSAEKAEEAYRGFVELAKSTPLEVGEILAGAQAMMQFELGTVKSAEGARKMHEDLKLLAVVARSFNSDIGSLVNGLNFLAQGNFNSRMMAHIGLTKRGLEQFGAVVGANEELLSKGTVNVDAAMKLWASKFGTMADKADALLVTRFSNILDQLTREIMPKIGESFMPLIDATLPKLATGLDRVAKAAENAKPMVMALVTAVGVALAPVLVPLAAAVAGLMALAEKAPGLLGAVTIALVALSTALMVNASYTLLMSSRFALACANAITLANVIGVGGALQVGLATARTAIVAFMTSFGGFLTLLALGTFGILKLADAIADRAMKPVEDMSKAAHKLALETADLVTGLEASITKLKGLPQWMAVTEAQALPLLAAFRDLVAANSATAAEVGLHATATGVLNDALGREIKTVEELVDAQKQMRYAEMRTQIEQLGVAADVSSKKLKEITSDLGQHNEFVTMLRHSYWNLVGAIAGYISQLKIFHRAQDLATKDIEAQIKAQQALNRELRNERSARQLSEGAAGDIINFTNANAREGYANLTEGTKSGLSGMGMAYKELTGKKLDTTSTWRSASVNAAVGGVKNSAHLSGRAFDVSSGDFDAVAAILGSSAAAYKWWDDWAKQLGMKALFEGRLAGGATKYGFSGRTAGGGMHFSVQTQGESIREGAVDAGLKAGESAAKEAEAERQRLAVDAERAAKDEYDSAARKLDVESAIRQVKLDEAGVMDEQLQLAKDRLALAQAWIKKGAVDELDVRQAELELLQAQKAHDDQVTAKRKELLTIAKQRQDELDAAQLELVERAGETERARIENDISTLTDDQQHRWRMRELTDKSFDELSQARQRLADIEEQQAQVAAEKAKLLSTESLSGRGPGGQAFAVAEYEILKAKAKNLANASEEAKAAIERALDDLAQAIRERMVNFAIQLGSAIGSGDFEGALNAVMSKINDSLIKAFTKIGIDKWSGSIGEGVGGALGGGVGALIGSVLGTVVGKLFKKGRKGGIVVEQDSPWVVRPEDPNITLALPSSYFFSGRGMPGLATAGTSVGTLAERQISASVDRERRRGQNW